VFLAVSPHEELKTQILKQIAITNKDLSHKKKAGR
jgi:hypothetical protein